MKPFKVEPAWGLIFGFFLAPVICVFNAVAISLLLQTWNPAPGVPTRLLNLGFTALLLTGPLGFFTTRLLEIWEKGDTAKARSLAIGCGLFSLCFWAWSWRTLDFHVDHRDRGMLIQALLLPFLWSLLFPIFAVFARTPRK